MRLNVMATLQATPAVLRKALSAGDKLFDDDDNNMDDHAAAAGSRVAKSRPGHDRYMNFRRLKALTSAAESSYQSPLARCC